MRKIADRIDEHMTAYPTITSENTSVLEAAEYMKQMEFRHLPVVENGKVVGILSERDLKQAELLSDSMQLLVCDVMTPNPYCVELDTPLSVVAREMATKKYGCVVVMNNVNQIVGIFTTTDGMRILSEILGSDHALEMRQWKIGKFIPPYTSLSVS